ncbi:MAG: CAP domain-containing protein [Polyangiaceae bacterium]|nr:CAP domain-containing protein [Polyangiaceae bacterium]
MPFRPPATLLATLLLATAPACAPDVAGEPGEPSRDEAPGAEQAAGANPGAAGAGPGLAPEEPGEAPPLTPDEAVCQRWVEVRAALTEGQWTGSVAECDPGRLEERGRKSALALLNYYRGLAGLPAVVNRADLDERAQGCALLMDANDKLSHKPPRGWECWSKQAAEDAGLSNLSGGPGVKSIDAYLVDPGNEKTLGHRRWLLSGALGPVGLGGTDDASCMLVGESDGTADPPYVAWPPPGRVPLQAFDPIWEPLDSVGWSIQSETLDLDRAEVVVREGDRELEVQVKKLAHDYGSWRALRVVPKGWSARGGASYVVSVSGLEQPIEYTVSVVACE